MAIHISLSVPERAVPPEMAMTAQEAARTLSWYRHREEPSWWVASTQHFRGGRATDPQVCVRSNSIEFNLYEAIAVAWTYKLSSQALKEVDEGTLPSNSTDAR